MTQQILVEARPDLAGIHEPAPTVVTQQQRSEPAATPSWVGVTADDELLFLLALAFEPIAGSPGHVHAIAIFCDDALPSLLARPPVVVLAFSLAVLRELQGALGVEGIAKYLLSVPEWNLPNVLTVEIEQVENTEPYRHFANQLGRRVLHAGLQLCKTGDLAIERDNLAIYDERSGFLLMDRLDHLGIFGVQPNSIPRKEIQIATTAKSEAATWAQPISAVRPFEAWP
jgi:hypothetical protein